MTTRRQFLQTSLATGGILLGAQAGNGIEPIQRRAEPHFRLSIAAYSYRKYLAAKPKPSMNLEDFARLAAQMNLDAIEPTSYYFTDTGERYLAGLKGLCTRLGLDISGTAVGNNFCLKDSGKLKQQLDSVKKWVDHASLLGCKTIRIFAGKVDKGDTEQDARKRAIETIEKACEYAGKYGIYLALENHGGITSTSEQLLAIVKGVKSPWFGVNLDTGNFRTKDPYGDLAKVAPYAVNVQLKTEISPKGGPRQEADLKRLLGILRDANYRGYIALEYEAKEEPKTAIPGIVQELQKLIRG